MRGRGRVYQPRMPDLRKLLIPLALLASAVPAAANDGKPPFWASIRAKEINMRVGPGEEYRIAWVYRRPGLPLKVLREVDSWWLVEDPGGAQGWMLLRFLNKNARTAYVGGQGLAEMREGAGGRLRWRVEPGVSGKLGSCSDAWCKFTVGDRAGYVPQDRLWGAGTP